MFPSKKLDSARLWIVAAYAVIIIASNLLVQFPLEHFGLGDWLTWGAFTYPFIFLLTDLVNRRYGLAAAKDLVLLAFMVAFFVAIIVTAVPSLDTQIFWNSASGALDFWHSVAGALLVGLRIVVASLTAFICAQMLDVVIFDKMRHLGWWRPPLLSSLVASAADSLLFFSLAFFATPVPWAQLAFADFLVKAMFALVLLVPYRLLTRDWNVYSQTPAT